MPDVKEGQVWRFVYQFIVEGWENTKRSLDQYNVRTAAAVTGTEKLTRAEWERARRNRQAHPDFKNKYDQLLRTRVALKEQGWEVQQLNKDQLRMVQSTKSATSATHSGVTQYELAAKALRQYGWKVRVVNKEQQLAQKKQLNFWPAWQQAISRYGGMRGGLAFRWARAKGGVWWQLAMGMLVAQRAAEAVGKALKSAMDQAGKTEKLKAAEGAFRAWGDASAVASRKFVESVQEATRFSGMEYEAVTLANKQALAGYEELAQAVPQIAEAAFYQARAVGATTSAVLKEWVSAIRDADAETMEATHGFTGLTDAVEQLADETDRSVDELSDEEKSAIILIELLPQLEQRTLDLAKSQGTLAADTKIAWSGFGEWIKDAWALVTIPAIAGIAPDPAFLAQQRWALQEILDQKLLWTEVKRMYKEGEIDTAAYMEVRARMRGVDPRRRALPIFKETRARMLGGDIRGGEERGLPGGLTEEQLIAASQHLRSVVYGEPPPSEYYGMSPDAAVALQEYQKQLKITRADEARLSDEARKAYEDADKALEQRIIGLAALGVSTVDIMGLLKTEGAELKAIYDMLGAEILEPEGQIRLIQFEMGLDAELDRMEAVKDLQEDINEKVSDFVVKAMDMGLPYTRAMQLGEEMGRQIEQLGDLSTEVAQHSLGIIEGAFDGMLYRMGRGVDSLMGKMLAGAMEIEKALQSKAKGVAVQIAPYTDMGNVEALYEGYAAELRAWQTEFGDDPESLTAMARREEIDARWEKIAKDLEKAATGMGQSTSNLKKAAEAMLLSSAAGNAALAYEIEHGASPLSAYARHEEPLTAWMMDKLAGEQYAKEHGGEAPSEDWWKARWFKEWYPLEQFHAPGAPIMAPSMDDPRAKAARERLAEQGVGEDTQALADIWHDEYLARKKLIPPLQATADKFPTLAKATGNLITAFEDATARFNKPPDPDGEEDPSRTRNYPGWRGDVHTDPEGITWYRLKPGEDRWYRNIPQVPGMAVGGYTGSWSGLTRLHPEELVLPLSDMDRTQELLQGLLGHSSFRGKPSASRGGLVIQGLTIPVNVYAPVGERMARDVGESVAGVGSRLGTQIVRAAQRAGLS